MSDFEELDGMDEEEYETIVLTDDEGNEVKLVVIDALEHKGNTYLLVFDEDDLEEVDPDNAVASVLKEIAEEEDNVVYEFVDDDDELQEIIELFQDNNDEFDMEL